MPRVAWCTHVSGYRGSAGEGPAPRTLPGVMRGGLAVSGHFSSCGPGGLVSLPQVPLTSSKVLSDPIPFFPPSPMSPLLSLGGTWSRSSLSSFQSTVNAETLSPASFRICPFDFQEHFPSAEAASCRSKALPFKSVVSDVGFSR